MELVATEANNELRRRVLWSVPTALGVLGTIDGERAHLMNVSWLTPVANEPTRLVVSIERNSRSNALLHARGVWALSLLELEQRSLGRAFVKPDLEWHVDDDGEWVGSARVERAVSGAPYLVDALAVLAGEATTLSDVGEHELWLLSVDEVGARKSLLEGPASAHAVHVLGVHDTRMNYGR